MIQMLLFDNVRGILEIRGRLQGVFRDIVALPMDEVLQLSPKEPGVLDGIDFILLMVIDEIGWRWRMNMLDWEDGRPVWSEEGFIEDHMSCR